jgi:hypothetical protein
MSLFYEEINGPHYNPENLSKPLVRLRRINTEDTPDTIKTKYYAI